MILDLNRIEPTIMAAALGTEDMALSISAVPWFSGLRRHLRLLNQDDLSSIREKSCNKSRLMFQAIRIRLLQFVQLQKQRFE